MRVAILADIHGNLAALDAALGEVERSRVDQLVIAGDVVVGSPDSAACWDRVKSLGCPILRGNHERYVFDLYSERATPEWHTPRFGPVQFAAAQVGESRRAEMAKLPETLRLENCPDVLFVHGSGLSDNDLIFPYTSDEEIEKMFLPETPRWIVRGHNHFSSVRLWGERRIVTVGSVGLPLDGTPSAQFTILEQRGDDWRVLHRQVRYDVDATLRRFRESGYLEAAGPMARLFQREVLTASFQILPFLIYFKKALAENSSLTLEAAVKRFLPIL